MIVAMGCAVRLRSRIALAWAGGRYVDASNHNKVIRLVVGKMNRNENGG